MVVDILCDGDLIGRLEERVAEMRSVFGRFTEAPGFERVRSLFERIHSLELRIESEGRAGGELGELERELDSLHGRLSTFAFAARWENGHVGPIDDLDWEPNWLEFKTVPSPRRWTMRRTGAG
jgi:hypothetical protein